MSWMVDELRTLRQAISTLEAELSTAKSEVERLRRSVDYRDCLEVASKIADDVACYDSDDLLEVITPHLEPLIGEIASLRAEVERLRLVDPEDQNTDLDQDWLEANCHRKLDVDDDIYEWTIIGETVLLIDRYGRTVVSEVTETKFKTTVESVHLRDCKTRGDVRLLCRALGVEFNS